MRHAFTIDVEEHFHVSAFADVFQPSHWEHQQSRVEHNTRHLLALMEEHGGTRGTFFILGWVAERYPELIREIHDAGHEIACHGYSHRLVFEQPRAEFEQETLRSKGLLEDIIGAPVLGYRAASFSITARSRWALDILAEAGFRYDSSIFPVRHDRYGMPGAQLTPHRLRTPEGSELVEFPLTSLDLPLVRLPVAGGGYFRLFPYAFTRWALRQASSRNGAPFVFYLHPWEVDPDQPRVEQARLLSRFRHYNNLERCEARLRRLLTEFEFAPMRDTLSDLGLLESPSQPAAA